MSAKTFVLDLGNYGVHSVEPGILLSISIFLITLTLLRIFRGRVLSAIGSFAKKTKTDLDDLLIDLIEGIPWTFYVLISIWAGLKFIEGSKFLSDVIGYAIIFVTVFYAVKASYIFIDFFKKLLIKKRKKQDHEEDVYFIEVLAQMIKYGMWLVAALLVLSNMGVDISALIAGMGVGGLAIALAAQNILSDIFAAFSIFFDKPYKVGDFLIIGEDAGVVKKIGIKSTRVDTLRGEELIIPNKEMTSTRIHNFGIMPHRRIEFSFGILYETPVDIVEKIPKMCEKIISAQEGVRFDRAHFKSFGGSSLDFIVVYYVESGDYLQYMDAQQAINLALMREFKGSGVEFAYPTQTIYVQKQ